MLVPMKVHNEDYEKVTVQMPGKYEVCPRCNGTGQHTNPSIDGNGLSEEMMEDEDFIESYWSGRYDVQCQVCHGKRVVPVVDVQKCSFAQKRMLVRERQWQDEEAKDRAYHLAEIRFGC